MPRNQDPNVRYIIKTSQSTVQDVLSNRDGRPQDLWARSCFSDTDEEIACTTTMIHYPLKKPHVILLASELPTA